MSNRAPSFKTLGLETVIPLQFAEYRTLISEGLIYFLENLSPIRTQCILDEQARLPVFTAAEERMAVLARQCPTLHKLGQVLARDRRLPVSLRSHLQGLESMSPSVSGRELQQSITAELGNLDEDEVAFEPEPLAEASVAVVLPFTWRDGRESHRGVFKVLKPNVFEHLEEELGLLPRVGSFLDDRCEHYGIPALDYKSLLDQVGERLSHEVRLDVEQNNLLEAHKSYAGQSDVQIPALFPFCTPRITAMQRIDGELLSFLADLTKERRQKLARLACENLIAHPIWCAQSEAVFHADPHAGNLLITEDNRLGILDWSLTARLTKRDRIYVSQILLGAIMLDGQTVEHAIEALASRDVDRGRLQKVIHGALRAVRCGELPGVTWLTRLLDQAVAEANIAFGTDLLMFRKVLLTLEGVLADLAEDFSADAMLASSFVARLVREWGDRMVTPAFSRILATHLSTADLMLAVLSSPLSASRFWTGYYQDFCQAWTDGIRRTA